MSNIQLQGASASTGNQRKWFDGDYVYKEDLLGYEGLVETLASRLAAQTNLTRFGVTMYEPVFYKGKLCCKSRNFNPDKVEELSLHKFLLSYYGTDLNGVYTIYLNTCDTLLETMFDFVRETVFTAYGYDIKEWLALTLKFDWLILNEDRHFRNLVFLKTSDGYRPSPLFDNGAGLLADTTMDYPMSGDVYLLMKESKAKTICDSFDEQLDISETLYGENIKFNFTQKDVRELLENVTEYTQVEKNRVERIVCAQMNKYGYLFK